MSAEIGGRAAKLGDSYERRWAVKHALMLINGGIRRLQWEPIGPESQGVDVEIVLSNGMREGHQLKRQNGSKAYWSVRDRDLREVLSYALTFLTDDTHAQFCFVSDDPVRHLKDLTDRIGRDPDQPDLFLSEHVKRNKERNNAYAELLRLWAMDPNCQDDQLTAFELLKRMRFEVFPRGVQGLRDLESLAGLQLSGDPQHAIALIGQFLEDHLGQRLYPDALLAYLEQKGHTPNDLARSLSLPTAIRSLRRRFLERLGSRLIAGRMLVRPEVSALVETISGPDAPSLVFLHGRAGCGKSAFLYELCRQLDAANVPTLPLQFQLQLPDVNPYRFGTEKLELPASPAHSLRAHADDRPAVLILDQLDALRLTSRDSHSHWECAVRIIEQALSRRGTSVVVACRTFDLENDPNIRKWKETVERRLQGRVEQIKLGLLDAETVKGVTEVFQVKLGDLPQRVQRLLMHPFTLDIWHDLSNKGQIVRDFSTMTDLLRRYLRTCRAEVVRDHNVGENHLGRVLAVQRNVRCRRHA